jgi:hypothetical protein
MHKFGSVAIACLIIISSGTIAYSYEIRYCTDESNKMMAMTSMATYQSAQVVCSYAKTDNTETHKIYDCVFEHYYMRWSCSGSMSPTVKISDKDWENVNLRCTMICGNCPTGWRTER